ncbi:MAG: glycogen debranching enzyme, partial [Candidatus Marinimicrobia bacterium]|nr:glycogen debranching enzyme [Candidatus Neomarinimicrobiota bacterium]
MFQAIKPLSNPAMGACWQEKNFQFGLVATDVVCIHYVFYADLLPQAGTEAALLNLVELDKQFQFGDVWGWQAEYSGKNEAPLTYLIQLEKSDGTKHFVIDPFARESRGGEQWGRTLGFAVDAEDYSLKVFSRTQDYFFHGIRRLPVIRPETPTVKITSRPPAPQHSLEQSIVYECHLRGMTRNPSSTVADSAASGTYLGLTNCIPHLKTLGVTAVELLPVFDFDENERTFSADDKVHPLYNYWGYSTLQFFAPKQNYAADVENAVSEFKAMVDKFHAAGLEIWLDVVFNHTAEFGADGPVDHFKSLAPDHWYLLEKDGSHKNYSGCGNTLKCAHPTSRRMIRECLIYWAHEMGVDGFRFDLATILNRDASGNVMDFPQLLWELRNDPSLKNIKLIAEPWDASGAYELGKASGLADWAEWNDKYRDTVRRALRGEEKMMEALKASILGSPEIFGSVDSGRKYSLNFLTSHDGMTLMDLVSYNEKHNEANGENNRDGHNSEFAENCGIEGPTNNQEIQKLRFRKVRMFQCLLQLSNGIPMLLGGDEFGRTQQGNNNA